MKKLKTLDEYNSLITAPQHNKEPELNGIACPKCGEELLDSNPCEILASNPPKKRIHCSKCTYKGFRNT